MFSCDSLHSVDVDYTKTFTRACAHSCVVLVADSLLRLLLRVFKGAGSRFGNERTFIKMGGKMEINASLVFIRGDVKSQSRTFCAILLSSFSFKLLPN